MRVSRTIPFTAALLAGGKSSRMGRDKAALKWEGQSLWQRQIHLLKSLRPEQILISGRPDGPYLESEYQIVFDAEPDLGPLGGIMSLLEACTTERLLVLAVDMPWMSLPVLEQMLSLDTGVVPMIDDRSEGAAAIYPTAIKPLIRSVLLAEDRSFQNLARLAVADGYVKNWEVPLNLQFHFRSWNSSILPA